MPARFEPDYAAIGRYMTDGSLYPALEAPAREVYDRAKALASQHVDTGAYAESIDLVHSRTHYRVMIEVQATDPIAEVLEARYHVLGRAAG